MQRLLGLPVARQGLAVGAAQAHRAPSSSNTSAQGPQQQQGPTSPNRFTAEEDDGFMHVASFTAPVQQHEVSSALTSLQALGAERNASPPPLPHSAAAAQHMLEIEELGGGAESDAGSDGEANRMISNIDGVSGAGFETPPRDASSSATHDLLAASIFNLLNNSEVTSVITRVMRSDPAFVALMEHVGPLTAVSLPAPARLLLLEDLTPHPAPPGGEPAGHPCEHGGDVGRSLLHLLEGIQRGVVAAAARVGETFCHLGGFLRGIGEHLRLVLAGKEEGGIDGAALEGDGGLAYARSPALRLEATVLQVAVAVAVVVLTRRLCVGPRMAM